MAKMFYKTDEVVARLKITPEQLKQLVSENKLREFRDGAQVMFKVDQVDRLATDAGGSKAGDSGIGLAPVDSGSHDAISLADSDVKTPGAKDDTVVTSAQPRAVFDSTEVKAADAGAQTQIQPALEDQLSLEGVGSGSGLLDLTRESDDTSLGAELLDEIYPGGEQKPEGIGSASGIFEQPTESASGPSGLENLEPAAPSTASVAAPVGLAEVVEAHDPLSGAFGGLAFASAGVLGLVAIVVGAYYEGYSPALVDTINGGGMAYSLGFGAVLLVISLLFALIGLFVGKASAR